MARIKRYLWNEAQSYGVLDLSQAGSHTVSKYGHGRGYHIIVTSNGKQWAAYTSKLDAESTFRDFELSKGQYNGSALDQGRLPPEYKLMLLWAKREFTKQAKAGILQPGTIIYKDAQQLEIQKAMKLKNGQPIVYSGFQKVKLPYTFNKFHSMLNESVAITADKWGGWIPRDPKVYIHTSGNVMGTAYNPGGQDYTISLNKKLVEQYTMDSVLRVILHEWCHHYRNRTWEMTGDSHDGKFCEALSLVDPTVEGDFSQCKFFSDVVDPAIAVQKAKQKKAPVFAANAGYLEIIHLKSGSFSCKWKPLKGYKWSAYNFKVNDIQWTRFVGEFSPEDWPIVQVIWPHQKYYSPIPMNWTLYEEAREMKHNGKEALTVSLLQTTKQWIAVFSKFDNLLPMIALAEGKS